MSDIRSEPPEWNPLQPNAHSSNFAKQKFAQKTLSRDEIFEMWENEVKKNMDWQKSWIEIIKPQKYMLKFRLPYNWKNEKYTYFKGELIIQSWAPEASGELRLIGDGKNLEHVEYPIKEYENKMYYINAILREWGCFELCDEKYDFQTLKRKKVDYCFDCALEFFILNHYLENANFIPHFLSGHKFKNVLGLHDFITSDLENNEILGIAKENMISKFHGFRFCQDKE